MADGLTIKVEGAEKIIDRLSTLPDKLQKKAAKVAARRAMAIVRDEARRNAKHLDDKDSPNAIWKNIRVQEATRSGRRIGGVVMRVGVAGGARLREKKRVRESKSADLPGKATQHWRLHEFGSSTVRAQPFMRPAFASKQGAVIEKVVSELSAAIDRLAASAPGAS
jgi:HK97 gp10 family phage protein